MCSMHVMHKTADYQQVALKKIFIAVLCLAVIHIYFINDFDYGTHGITSIGIHIPGGGHFSLLGSPKVKVEDDEEYIAFCMAVKDQS